MSGALRPRPATEERYVLAEGPFWDGPRERLLWVDIEAGLVLSGVLTDGGRIREVARARFDGRVGAVASAEDGSWIVAVDGRVVRRTASGAIEPGPELLPAGGSRRLNDGKPDPAGRYLVGSLQMSGSSNREQLFLLGDGVRSLDDDLTLSNGLGWSPDGRTMYSIDTGAHLVHHRPWDPATGAPGDRETLLDLGDEYPDGMTIDADGGLWIAMWGIGQVRRYTPEGRLDRTVQLPVPYVSSVAFAGRSLRTLVITTSYRDHGIDERERLPDAGRLFTLDAGVAGAPQALWSGHLPAPERTPS